jgi:hypothetical protein
MAGRNEVTEMDVKKAIRGQGYRRLGPVGVATFVDAYQQAGSHTIAFPPNNGLRYPGSVRAPFVSMACRLDTDSNTKNGSA